jgi:hypothetical protein
MSVYVGIDVHRKRSRVAVVSEDGTVELSKNTVNGAGPMLRLTGDPPGRDAGGVRGRVRLGLARGVARGLRHPARTWCTRCGARPSPRPG